MGYYIDIYGKIEYKIIKYKYLKELDNLFKKDNWFWLFFGISEKYNKEGERNSLDEKTGLLYGQEEIEIYKKEVKFYKSEFEECLENLMIFFEERNIKTNGNLKCRGENWKDIFEIEISDNKIKFVEYELIRKA
jgi:hypothetical protein